MKKSVEQLSVGDRVTGIYCFEPYAGEIIKERRHGCSPRLWVFTIKPDQPLKVFGETREEFNVTANLATGEVPGASGITTIEAEG